MSNSTALAPDYVINYAENGMDRKVSSPAEATSDPVMIEMEHLFAEWALQDPNWLDQFQKNKRK